MNIDRAQYNKREELHSDFDEIVRKSEGIIMEFQRLNCEVDRKSYSLFRLFWKNRSPEMYTKLLQVDDKLADMVAVADRFRMTNMRYLAASMQTYIMGYEDYLQSVKTASELRVSFERRFMELNLSTSNEEDVEHTKKLAAMIESSLDTCEKKAHRVNLIKV